MDKENSFTIGKVIFAKTDLHALVELYLYFVGIAFIFFVARVEFLSIWKGSKEQQSTSSSDPISDEDVILEADSTAAATSNEDNSPPSSMEDDDRLPQGTNTIKVKKEPKAPSTPPRSPQQNLGLILSPEGYRKSARLMNPTTTKETTAVKGRRKSIL
mmetsp:Transcript_13798/g.20667  ORF Transcript_13798/g.20667 Transcript_13798/m.20667 type:complete len:158 (+) Transcript_13798:61-534(+)